MDSNKQVALKVLKGAFIERDSAVVDRYFSPDYVQHNPVIPKRTGGDRQADTDSKRPLLRDRYGCGRGRSGDGSWTLCRLGPKPLVAVDIFKVKDGKVVEHWDVMQEEVPASATASGNPMFTPASETGEPDFMDKATQQRNKDIVLESIRHSVQ